LDVGVEEIYSPERFFVVFRERELGRISVKCLCLSVQKRERNNNNNKKRPKHKKRKKESLVEWQETSQMDERDVRG
jgi:hypothetical protein